MDDGGKELVDDIDVDLPENMLASSSEATDAS